VPSRLKQTRNGLSDEDRAWRRAAHAYFALKTPQAEARFDTRSLTAFLSFCEHWHDYFAPEHPETLVQYLALPLEQRRAQFERFRRECHSWETTFKLPVRAGRGPTPGGTNGSHSRMRRRIEQHNLREAGVRALYANLDSRRQRAEQQLHCSPELLTHLRELGLSPDVTLEQARSQYRRLALLHHPDRAGDEAKMQRLNHAFRAVMLHFKRATN
jgi:curved DNA-binding protein CbpA